jgi:hypothetical protein
MQRMNALSYLRSIEIPLSNKDDEYAQNVANFIRHIMRKVKEDAEIDEKYVLRLRDLLHKYGVYWGVNHRQVDRIAKWINSKREHNISIENLSNRMFSANQYKWRGGTNSCYEIQDKEGAVLFCLWSQFHAITVLLLCKRIQKLTSQNPYVER